MTTRAQVLTPPPEGAGDVLNDEALAFLAALHRRVRSGAARAAGARAPTRQRAFDGGALPDFLPETAAMRGGDWQVAPAPADLQNRRVEITGPVERKMMINALNSGAQVFMADFEDSLSPTWENVIDGPAQLHRRRARARSRSNRPRASRTG